MRPSPWQVGHLFVRRPGAVAARASQAEAHRAGHLRHVAAAVAFRTDRVARRLRAPVPSQVAQTSWRVMFSRTCVPLIACQKSMLRPYSRSAPFSGAVLAAARSLPSEPLAENVLEIRGFAGSAARCRAAAAARAAARETSEKSNPPKPMFGPRCPHRPAPAARRHAVFRIEAELIVHLLLLRLAQNVVGFLDFLEAVLGGLVAGIQIGMMFAREFAVGLADLLRIGVALHPECLIVIVLRPYAA